MAQHGLGYTEVCATWAAHLVVFEFQALLDVFYDEGCECVKSFTDRLEHDEAQRNARYGIKHAEQFASDGLGSAMTVTWKTTHRRRNVKHNSFNGQWLYFAHWKSKYGSLLKALSFNTSQLNEV